MRLYTILILLPLLFSCNNQPNYTKKEKEVIEIGKREIEKTYGREILNSNEPYTIRRKDSVWEVKGTLPDGMEGGVPFVLIDTATLVVVNIYHTK